MLAEVLTARATLRAEKASLILSSQSHQEEGVANPPAAGANETASSLEEDPAVSTRFRISTEALPADLHAAVLMIAFHYSDHGLFARVAALVQPRCEGEEDIDPKYLPEMVAACEVCPVCMCACRHVGMYCMTAKHSNTCVFNQCVEARSRTTAWKKMMSLCRIKHRKLYGTCTRLLESV